MRWLLAISAATAVLLLVVAVSIRRSRRALVQLARLVPTCLALLRDILRDPEVPRRAKLAPALALVSSPWPGGEVTT